MCSNQSSNDIANDIDESDLNSVRYLINTSYHYYCIITTR